MTTCTCGKAAPGSQLCLVLYDKTEPGTDKKTTKSLGAMETVRCERCLAREAWKQVGRDLLVFLLGIVVVSALAGLIGKVFELAWVGGGILVLGLLFGLVKKLLNVVKRTARNGAALCAQREYRGRGWIPREDLLFLTREGEALLENDRISLEKLGEYTFLTVAAAEDALQSAPADSEEIMGIRQTIDRARSLGSPDVLAEPPGIRRAFYSPLAAGFLLLLAAVVAVILLLDVPDTLAAGQSAVSALEVLTAVVTFGGALGMALRRKPVWYVPLALAVVLFWVLAMRWGEDLRYHYDEPLILSLAVVIPSLCFLPQVLRGKEHKKGGNAR